MHIPQCDCHGRPVGFSSFSVLLWVFNECTEPPSGPCSGMATNLPRDQMLKLVEGSSRMKSSSSAWLEQLANSPGFDEVRVLAQVEGATAGLVFHPPDGLRQSSHTLFAVAHTLCILQKKSCSS